MSNEKSSNQIFSAKYFQLVLHQLSDADILSLQNTATKIMAARRRQRTRENNTKYQLTRAETVLNASQKLVDYADFLSELETYLVAKNQSFSAEDKKKAIEAIKLVKLPSIVKKKSVVNFYKNNSKIASVPADTYFYCVVDSIHVYDYRYTYKSLGYGSWVSYPYRWVKSVSFSEPSSF
jgi:hypothetical protein